MIFLCYIVSENQSITIYQSVTGTGGVVTKNWFGVRRLLQPFLPLSDNYFHLLLPPPNQKSFSELDTDQNLLNLENEFRLVEDLIFRSRG